MKILLITLAILLIIRIFAVFFTFGREFTKVFNVEPVNQHQKYKDWGVPSRVEAKLCLAFVFMGIF